MAKIKEVKNEALAIIDGALAILNKFPDLDQTDISLSANSSVNPLPFLIDLFKRTAGYNVLIQIVSKLIAWNIPLLEAGVKTILISRLKDIISCSVNPFFTEDVLRDGIVFNSAEIDIADVLKYSPFDEKVGQYFYFDTGNFEEEYIDEQDNKKKRLVTGMPEDLIKSDDLNSLIWYMINVSTKRYVWKPKKYRKGAEFREDYPKNTNDKLKKEDGIITLEYHRTSKNIKDAYGNNYYLQTPYSNCLHVFIGDVREKENVEIQELLDASKEYNKEDKTIQKYNTKIQNKKDEISKLEETKNSILLLGYVSNEDLQIQYNIIQEKIDELNKDIEDLERLKQKSYQAKNRLNYTLETIKNELSDVSSIYFPFIVGNKVRNYYYGKSLIEFNIDYIESLKLFDAKSLAARLLDCMTASLVIDLHLSYKQQLIKNEVKKMVQMVTETDDITISDCFFTFSNKDYDEMTRKAELRKAGLLTINGDETSAVKINADKIFSKLNEINKDTNKETVQSIINGSLNEISKELSNVDYLHTDDVNYGVEVNFIENILQSLAEVLTMTVLSPKVYLLLLINLKIIGRETNFNLEGFIEQYKQLLADLIRSIRDTILEYITKELMIIIGDLVKEITLKLSIEQALYWQRLFKRLIDCFKYKRQKFNIDFNIDDVDYADILPDEEEPINSEC